MRFGLSSIVLLLPALLGKGTFGACHGVQDQVSLRAGGEWNITGYAIKGCGGDSTTASGEKNQGCTPIDKSIPAISFQFDGIDKFKACLWGDSDCTLYKTSTGGDKGLTCRPTEAVDSFTIIDIKQACRSE